MRKPGRASKAKAKVVTDTLTVTDSPQDERVAHSSAVMQETLIVATVAAAELVAAEPGPDPDSAALVTPTLRSQGMRPIPTDNPGGVTCPECGTPLVIAPKAGSTYVVCYAALSGDGACWYYRELPASSAKGKKG